MTSQVKNCLSQLIGYGPFDPFTLVACVSMSLANSNIIKENHKYNPAS